MIFPWAAQVVLPAYLATAAVAARGISSEALHFAVGWSPLFVAANAAVLISQLARR
jgi:hypothetical protein